MKITKGIASLIFFLLPLFSLAQNKVSGKVTNYKDGSAASNVTVIVKGKNVATKTDSKGNFEIAAEKGDVLLFTSISFASKKIKVVENTISVGLNPFETDLEEVVVTTMDRKLNPRELGASIQVVGGKDIQDTKRENFLNSLQGRVAGLTVTPTSGVAGDRKSTRLNSSHRNTSRMPSSA